MDCLCAADKGVIMILCSNPKTQYLSYKSEIDAAIFRVLNSGWYILGNEVRSFEEEFANYIGVAHGIGVGSGTEALHLALSACGVTHGDEVITVSHTAVATVAAIGLADATPVLVDIDPDFYTIDPEKIESAISSNTKAIIPVHIYGQPADMDPVMEIAEKYSLKVIEDCAQAHGSKYKGQCVGSFGDMGCFSFYPTKNLGAIGDGGMVVTNNSDLNEKVKLLREYGWKERYVSSSKGWNSRLDEIQASILRVKLKHLDKSNQKRRKLAGQYLKDLKDLPLELPEERKNCAHVYHLFVIKTNKRDMLQDYLKENGICTSIHYPVPINRQPHYKDSSKNRFLEVTEKVAGEILSLPVYPELSLKESKIVINTIKEFYLE